jgi:hypothetical protein
VLKNSHRCCTVLYIVSAVGYALEGELLASCVPATYSALFIALILCVWDSRRCVLTLTGTAAAGFAAAGLVQYAAVFGGSRRLINGYRTMLPLDILTALGTGAFSLGIHACARFLHYRSVTSAKALAAADHRAYDAAWAELAEDSAAAPALRKIEQFVACRWGQLGAELLHQRACESDPLARARAPPIESLDQLFGQAGVLVAFLRAKAKGWALQSQGRFPVLQGDAATGGGRVKFELWEDIARDEDMMRRVKWSRIKSTKRAVEKIYRCYAGEISRLVDCCRCCAGRWAFFRLCCDRVARA